MFSLGNFLGVEKENRSLLYRIYFAFFASGAMSTLLGAILPEMGESYGLDYAFRGVLLSAHQIGNLVAVIASGFIPYLLGRKKSSFILGMCIVLGLVLMTLTGNPVMLFIAFAFTGIGRGTMSNITNVVVGENASNKAAGLNLLHASFAVGAFISPFVAIAVIPSSWRFAPWIFAVLMFITLILIAFSTLSSAKMERKKGEGAIPRSPQFWLNTFIMFFYLCGEASLMGWLVTYFQDAGIFPDAISTAMQSFLWVMILIGRLICAVVSTKVNKNVLILILGIMMTSFFILMITASNPVVIVIAVLLVGVSMSGIYPTTLSTMEQKYNSSTVATGLCIGTATVGAIIMPSVVGTVAERAGIEGGVATISVALAIMVILMVVKALTSRAKRSE
ncbi:MAG: MFS transporter [Spirochaetes bacterium]|uniref:MFS transporter n=1 Tax=Candidatus Ornithospirochaeta stercoripullorum TaxID=2840899 RepID=A0A9D9H5W0_9SPIO|nr:MFS transporter [Candidatus Ornithospirochaeta stercoripullorum]